MKTPEFWYAPSGLLAAALSPAARIYGCAAACARARKSPWRAPVSVISVGNLTAGGAGKTPVALELTARLQAQGGRPAVVLRGYGAAVKGALQVDAARHGAADAGDEALLHAKAGPTWVSPDRRAGAEAAIAAGCDMIVLDDAHQNRDLHKTLSIVVINGADGFGNGRMIPAGPLREPVQAGLARADAVIILGEDKHNCAAHARAYMPEGAKVIAADVAPDAAARALAGETCAAFAGVARPEKVFTTMRGAGLKIISTHAFADHHAYTQGELARLHKTAAAAGARLVTTTKDWVRLPVSARGGVTPFGVRVVWRDESEIDALLAGARNHA
ncbi:MAG: tetraacyldisaccharide 4'-kinase [Rhodospirillales bacterium]